MHKCTKRRCREQTRFSSKFTPHLSGIRYFCVTPPKCATAIASLEKLAVNGICGDGNPVLPRDCAIVFSPCKRFFKKGKGKTRIRRVSIFPRHLVSPISQLSCAYREDVFENKIDERVLRKSRVAQADFGFIHSSTPPSCGMSSPQSTCTCLRSAGRA